MIPTPKNPSMAGTLDRLRIEKDAEVSPQWAEPGRIVEVSGRGAVARTSSIVSQVVAAQAMGEPVAWVQAEGTEGLFAPDLAEAGVDLDALIWIRVPRLAADVLRATELLLRSGGFGMVVADLAGAETAVSMGALARLGGLARQHRSAVVLLSARDAEAPAIGSLVSLRLVPERERASMGFVVEGRWVRNKTGRPEPDPQVFAAPEGASSVDRVVSFDEEEAEAPRVALAS